MVASIDNLKSTISSRGGIARPNNFLVELPSLPGFSRASDPLNILCTNASIPSKQILTTDRRIGMEFEKIAYGYAVDDVSLTFLLTNDYYVRRYFDKWKDFIISENRQVAAYKNDYQAKVVIHQLNSSVPRTAFDIKIGALPIGIDVTNFLNSIATKAGINIGVTTYSVELIDAFPTTVSAIEFNNQPDAFIELNVQMSYTNFKRAESSQISFKL